MHLKFFIVCLVLLTTIKCVSADICTINETESLTAVYSKTDFETECVLLTTPLSLEVSTYAKYTGLSLTEAHIDVSYFGEISQSHYDYLLNQVDICTGSVEENYLDEIDNKIIGDMKLVKELNAECYEEIMTGNNYK